MPLDYSARVPAAETNPACRTTLIGYVYTYLLSRYGTGWQVVLVTTRLRRAKGGEREAAQSADKSASSMSDEPIDPSTMELAT